MDSCQNFQEIETLCRKKKLIRKEKAEIQIVESDAMAQSASGMLEAND